MISSPLYIWFLVSSLNPSPTVDNTFVALIPEFLKDCLEGGRRGLTGLRQLVAGLQLFIKGI